MLTLTIVQPIATIHKESGLLRAVRILRWKVKCSNNDKLCDKQYILQTDMPSVHISEIMDRRVIDVDMWNCTRFTKERALLVKHDTSDTASEITLLGTFRMPAILADGTVIKPWVYQYLGEMLLVNARNDMRMLQDLHYVDYEGTIYTPTQLKKKVPASAKYSRKLERGIALDSKGDCKYVSTLLAEQGFCIGNFNASIYRGRPYMRIYDTCTYETERYKQQSAAQAVMTVCKGEIVQQTLGDLKLKAQVINDRTEAQIPAVINALNGVQSVCIGSEYANITYVTLPETVYVAKIAVPNLQRLEQARALLHCELFLKQGSIHTIKPKVCGIYLPVIRRATLTYAMRVSEYKDEPYCLDTLRDMQSLTIELANMQPAPLLELPLCPFTMLTVPVSRKELSVIFVPPKHEVFSTAAHGFSKVMLNFMMQTADSVVSVKVCKAQLEQLKLTMNTAQHAFLETADTNTLTLHLASAPKVLMISQAYGAYVDVQSTGILPNVQLTFLSKILCNCDSSIHFNHSVDELTCVFVMYTFEQDLYKCTKRIILPSVRKLLTIQFNDVVADDEVIIDGCADMNVYERLMRELYIQGNLKECDVQLIDRRAVPFPQKMINHLAEIIRGNVR